MDVYSRTFTTIRIDVLYWDGPTRQTTVLESKVNPPGAIDFKAVCTADMRTSVAVVADTLRDEVLVVHRVVI